MRDKRRTIVYIGYVSFCHFFCFASWTLKKYIDTWRRETFNGTEALLMAFVLFLIFGLVWAVERIVAKGAAREIVIVVRSINVLVLAWPALTWVLPGGDFYMAGDSVMIAAVATVGGYQLFEVILMLVSKGESEESAPKTR